MSEIRKEIIESLTDYYDLDNGELEKALQMPLVYTERQCIRNVANRWKERFPNKEETYNKLLGLDLETAMPEAIAEIIGNDSWTKITCNQCKRDVKAVVTVGSYPIRYYEKSTASICIDCIDISRKKLLEAIKMDKP
jgi:hypothetical protein